MSIFEVKKNDSYTIIIGCGRLGANLANGLSDEGENVMIVDTNESAFRRLDPSFGGLSMVGDGTDFDILKEAEIHNASTVIAVTNDDNTNIMIAQIAKEVFYVEKVIARLYDPDYELIYKELGIDTICPAVLSAKEIDKLLSKLEIKEDPLCQK